MTRLLAAAWLGDELEDPGDWVGDLLVDPHVEQVAGLVADGQPEVGGDLLRGGPLDGHPDLGVLDLHRES